MSTIDDYPDETWGGVSDEEIALRSEVSSVSLDPPLLDRAAFEVEIANSEPAVLAEWLAEIYQILWVRLSDGTILGPEGSDIDAVAESFRGRGYGQ